MGLQLVLAPLKQQTKQAFVNASYRIANYKKGVQIGSHVELSGVKFGRLVSVSHHAQIGKSAIGDRTSIGRYSKIRNASIGKYCSISWDVTIGAVSHAMFHPSSHAFWYRRQFGIVNEDRSIESKEVRIGNDVWIGCAAVIMPGVSIGNGAIIGANSVVTKNVNPYSVVAGCPAKEIRKRFDHEQAEMLESLHWWDWPDETLAQNTWFFEQPIELKSLELMKDRL